MQACSSELTFLETPGAVWQDEAHVDVCNGRRCGRRFNRFFCLKHHCRWCGRVYCDACAPRQYTRHGRLLRRCNRCRLPVIFKFFWNPQTRQLDCEPLRCILSFLTPRATTALLQSCATMLSEFPICGYRFYETIQERFPSYFTGAQIGRGSFGTVYKCEDRLAADHRRVILKCVRKSTNVTYTRWERALTELRILASIKHRNVARLLEAFQTREFLVIVMEAGEGGTVRQGYEFIRSHVGLSVEAFTANVLEGVAAGLDYLYREKRVIHRDIKLDNIVLSADYATPMIIDFGLAEYVVQEDGQWYVVGGTRNYAPPESIGTVAAGHMDMKETGLTMHKGDLFSLGVVAYVLLTAHRPFQSKKFDKQYEEMRRGISCEGPLWDGVSAGARALVRALLSFSPLKRPDYAEIAESPFIVSRGPGVTAIQEARTSGLQQEEEETREQWVVLEPSDLIGDDTEVLSFSSPQRWYQAYLPRSTRPLW